MPEIRLTPREEQVLRHVRAGSSNKDIAEAIGISEQGVKALVSRLLLKFSVPNRTTLAAEARHPGNHDKAHNNLQIALSRSRELRDKNRELMGALRREFREFRTIRKRLSDTDQRARGR